jgi:membrane-associated phospholipid phosphatase
MLYEIGEFGPLLFCSIALVIGAFRRKYFLWLIALVVILEWSIIGSVWKFVMLPWGTTRPKYGAVPLTLKTTGMPSAHTACMVAAIILSVYSTVMWKTWGLLIAACLLAVIVVYQRISYGYHSQTQVLIGACVGGMDALLWGLFFIVIYTSNPHGKITKCLSV